MEGKYVVTCFMEHGKKIALLKRSELVGSYRGRWAGISGYIEEGNTPYKQALEEIMEEVRVDKGYIELVKVGEPLEVIDEKLDSKWIVHPYRFRVIRSDKIEVDWEHTEIRWIDPGDMGEYETVPQLREAWEELSD
jgi:8-oxo-dGTP pyrophosphatase MutT (NUDIX family)